jgi:hypothetical protein
MSGDERSRALECIRAFLAGAAQPVAVEPGHDPIPLAADSYEIAECGDRILIQAWTADRNLVRRVTAVQNEAKGRLDLAIERFGQRTGTLQLIDAARPESEKTTKRAGRLSFREVFRRMLARQYPGWQICELTTEADLQHSLSPACARAFLRRGAAGRAAIGAAPEGDPEGVLSFGLIWLDYLRRREPKLTVEGLTIFVPAGSERTTCHRIRHLDRTLASFSVFAVKDRWEQPVDIADAGNIESVLVNRAGLQDVPKWLQPVLNVPGVETIEAAGGWSLRVRGLEFARCVKGEVRAGLHSKRVKRERNRSEVEKLAVEIASMRRPDVPASAGGLASAVPERWLEGCIRAALPVIDAGLLPEPVYSQAPTVSGAERGVIDLLAAGIDGRLAVVEVKASEDIHLPLQALDYWARVKAHLEAGDFERCSYFRSLQISTRAPRLLLVAPALQFHPTTETILRFYAPGIEVERVGLAMNWRTSLKVVFRARGSAPAL